MTNGNSKFFIRLGATALTIIAVMAVAKLLFFSGQQESASRVDLRPVGISSEQKTKAISWQDAAEHYGEYCTVEGTIVVTNNSGKACFLNFHPNWKKYFTAVIFANRFSMFPATPERYYQGKKVRVTGYIKEYQGKPEIILESPEQIEILN
jgi:DNA/RNA endonuclease YhcR with UshA esterase domain